MRVHRSVGQRRAGATVDVAVNGLLASASISIMGLLSASTPYLLAISLLFVGGFLRSLQFTAPLTAITAAVVGVILNLALFFGAHVLWPQGLGDGGLPEAWQLVDVTSLALTLAAALALFRFKRSVLQVIAGAALAGLALRLAGVA